LENNNRRSTYSTRSRIFVWTGAVISIGTDESTGFTYITSSLPFAIELISDVVEWDINWAAGKCRGSSRRL